MSPADKVANILNGYLHNAIRMGAVDYDAPRRMANAIVNALGLTEDPRKLTPAEVVETCKRSATMEEALLELRAAGVNDADCKM